MNRKKLPPEEKKRMRELHSYFGWRSTPEEHYISPRVCSFKDYIRVVLKHTPIMVSEAEEIEFEKYITIFEKLYNEQSDYEHQGWNTYHPTPAIRLGDLSRVNRYWWNPQKRRQALSELVAALPSEKKVRQLFKKAVIAARTEWLKKVAVKGHHYTVILRGYKYSNLDIDGILRLIRYDHLYPKNGFIFAG